MISTTPLHGLLALADERHLGRAAQASRMSPAELAQALQALEAEYGHALLRTSAPPAERGQRFEGFTPQGERVLAWARGFLAQSEALRSELQASRTEAALAPLLERRSVSPKRLRPPAPTAEHIDAMLQAALRAPDHGGLHPWRVIEFREAQRAALAERFEAEKLRRDPLASASDRRRARASMRRARPRCWPSWSCRAHAARCPRASNGWPPAPRSATCSMPRINWASARSC